MTTRGAWLTLVLCAVGPAATVQGASDHRLWDQAHLLSQRERLDVDRRLRKAGSRLGSPLFVLVTDRLRHETAAGMADRAFAARVSGEGPESNPVLLLFAAHDHAAAIATGKGNAGIVPEMDAARITRNLVALDSHQTLKEKLARAVDAIVESAEATAERRRPLSTEDDDLPPADAPLAAAPALIPPAESPAFGDDLSTKPDPDKASSPTVLDRNERDRPTHGPGRSRIPLAVGVAVLLMLGLALRRRRQIAAIRHGPTARGRPETKREGPSSSRQPPP